MTDISERISKLSSAKLELLAQRLPQDKHSERVIPRRARRDTPAVLSYPQQRMWILHQLEPDSPALNSAAAVRLRGPLSLAALNYSLSEIVRRHESLRTTFQLKDGEPVQVVHEASEWNVSVIDLSLLKDEEQDAACD